MKLKTTLVALVAALGLSNVQANTYDLGALSAGSFTSGQYSVANANDGSFTDTFNFSLTSLSNLSGAFAVNVLNTNFFINAITLTNSLTTTTGSIGTFDSAAGAFAATSLGGGAYSLSLSGYETGEKGGKYTLSYTLAPVPEPETYAMFLAGLGLMGVIARRRRGV